MREVAVVSGKGGTGKTTVAGALAVLAGVVEADAAWTGSGSGGAVFADCDVDAANLALMERCAGLGVEVAARLPYDPTAFRAAVRGVTVVEHSTGEMSRRIRRLWDRLRRLLDEGLDEAAPETAAETATGAAAPGANVVPQGGS